MYATPAQPNALQQMAAIQGIANAAEQNKLLGIAQQRGQQDLQLGQQQLQQGALNISTAQAQRWSQQLELVGQALAATYAQDGGNPTRKHVVDAVSDLATNTPPGTFDRDFPAKALHDLPSDDEEAKAQAQGGSAVKSWLIGHAYRNQVGREAIKPFLPQPQALNAGPVTTFPDTNPLSNPGITGASVAMGQSPAEMAAPAQWTDERTGKTVYGTNAQRLRVQQAGSPNAGGGNTAPGTYLPGAAGQPITRSGPLADNEGIRVTPGTAEAASLVSQASGAQAADLQKHAEAFQQTQATLRNLNDLKEKFSTGPFAGLLGKIKGAGVQINNALGRPLALNETRDALAAQEEFKKQAALLVQQQEAAGGTTTDDKRSLSIMTNPNEAISNLGLDGVINTLQGTQDAVNARFQAFHEYAKAHGGPASYGDFLAEHGKDFEPRAYQLQYMGKEEGKKFLGTLTPNEYDAVDRAWRYGQQNKYLKPNQGTQGR